MQIQQLFPGRLAVSPSAAAFAVLGWTPSTTRTKLCRNQFPLPLVIIGGKRLVRISDLIKFVESQVVVNGEGKRRGRPTKVEQIARAALQQGGAQ